MALFAFEELTFRYPEAPRDALRDVSVAIEPGQFVLVCGQSGCGKTTLLRQFKSALAPHGHQSGRVLFDGVPFADVPEREQVARIGFVMQNPDAQIVTDKVWHELAFVLESLGCDERTMRLRVAEMASYFGIQHWFHKNVGELSGGQIQLLNLASGMAARPVVLVLDEPTAALDPATTAAIHRLLREMNDGGTTIFLTTHNMEEADRLCARVAFLNEGRIAETGVPAQLKLKYAKDRVRVLLEDGEALECARNPEAIGALLADLSGRGIASVHSEEPDLEEIFLQVTGRNLV